MLNGGDAVSVCFKRLLFFFSGGGVVVDLLGFSGTD